MGFFDTVFDIIDIAEPILDVGAQIFSTVSANEANRDAADRIARSEEARIEEIRKSNELAQQQFEAFTGAAAPAVDVLQRLAVTDPFILTPLQQQGRDDASRDARAVLAASNLRGSGRAGVAAVQLADQDFVNNAVESNIRRQDSAARALANAGLSGASQVAGLQSQTGQQAGQAGVNAANAQAGADVANANNFGIAANVLSATIADELKRFGRPERTQRRPAETE